MRVIHHSTFGLILCVLGCGPGGSEEGPFSETSSLGARDPRCAQPNGTKPDIRSIRDMRRFLARKWILCSELGLGHEPQEGFEITQDDRFALLEATTDGLSPKRGIDYEGSVEYLETSASPNRVLIQTNFVFDRHGVVIAHPAMSEKPTFLIIDNNGSFFYRYVAAAEIATTGGPF